MNDAACSARSHPASTNIAQARSNILIFVAGVTVPIARLREGVAKAGFVRNQLGREGRKTLRVGERHWQP